MPTGTKGYVICTKQFPRLSKFGRAEELIVWAIPVIDTVICAQSSRAYELDNDSLIVLLVCLYRCIR